MKKIALFILSISILLLSGCSPFTNQYRQLNAAYQAGQLTYPEYVQAYQNLQAQEMQWRQNFAQSMQQQAAQQQAYQQQQFNNQLAVMQLNQQSRQNNQPSYTNTNCHYNGYNNWVCDSTTTR